MNIKFLSIFVLAILVVGLSTVSAVAATDSGVSQSVPKDKLMSFVICKGIEGVKVVERRNTPIVTSSKKKVRQIIRGAIHHLQFEPYLLLLLEYFLNQLL